MQSLVKQFLELVDVDDLDTRVLRSALPFLVCVVSPVYKVQLPVRQGTVLTYLHSAQVDGENNTGKLIRMQLLKLYMDRRIKVNSKHIVRLPACKPYMAMEIGIFWQQLLHLQ